MTEPVRAVDSGARACAPKGRAHSGFTGDAIRRIEALQRENAELRSACAEQMETVHVQNEAIEKLSGEILRAQSDVRVSPGRGKANERVRKECNPLEFKFEGVPFFDHFGIRDAKQLKEKLAAFLIGRDADVNTPGKRRTTTNQAKFKADNFVTLLWFNAPGDPPPYAPGDVDGLFAFFCNKDHADMGKKRAYFNHDHRVCTWLWPSRVSDYASFKADANKYVARQGRGFMTGVRAVHGLYQIWKGEASWPDVERNPVDEDATPGKRRREAKARVRAGRKRVRKAKRSNEEDDEDSAQSSGDESEADEGAWSCDDSASESSESDNDPSEAYSATAQAFEAIGRYAA